MSICGTNNSVWTQKRIERKKSQNPGKFAWWPFWGGEFTRAFQRFSDLQLLGDKVRSRLELESPKKHGTSQFGGRPKIWELPIGLYTLYLIQLAKRICFGSPRPRCFCDSLILWLVVSTHLKNGLKMNLPQVGVKIKNVWSHHPVLMSNSNFRQKDYLTTLPVAQKSPLTGGDSKPWPGFNPQWLEVTFPTFEGVTNHHPKKVPKTYQEGLFFKKHFFFIDAKSCCESWRLQHWRALVFVSWVRHWNFKTEFLTKWWHHFEDLYTPTNIQVHSTPKPLEGPIADS